MSLTSSSLRRRVGTVVALASLLGLPPSCSVHDIPGMEVARPSTTSSSTQSVPSSGSQAADAIGPVSPLPIEEPIEVTYSDTQGRAAQTLPARFDLREQGRLTPVRTQRTNGPCWAFAALASVESSLMPGMPLDLSENDMVNRSGFDRGPYGGGTRQMAAAYLASGAGPVSERGGQRVVDVLNIHYLPKNKLGPDNPVLKRAIMNEAAVFTLFFQEAYYLNRKVNYFAPTSHPTNHAVAIVGWDDNYSASNFLQRPEGDGAWIIRNSWGTKKGEQGYYYVSYYDRQIGTANAVYLGSPTGTYKRIYQHDPLGATDRRGPVGDAWYANVFTARGTEHIGAVGLWSLTAGVDYEVYLAPVTGGRPDVSKAQLAASGALPYAGYHTIETSGMDVTAGQAFSVIVHVRSNSSDHLVPAELPISGYSSRASAEPGQSFISTDGTNWRDFTEIAPKGNVALKALATR